MAYYNGFPATYPQAYPQGYPGQQMPMYAQQMAQAGFQQPTQMSGANQPAPAQMLTPPTIRAEIVQVEDEQAAANFPVGAGASQMMIARDESAIFIKSAMANGQTTLDVFQKRPPAPPAPAFDPAEYVRRDELDERVSAIVAAQMAQSTRSAAQESQKAQQRKTRQEVE